MNTLTASSPLFGLTRRQWVFTFISILCAAVLQYALADHRGFWIDEWITLHDAQKGWAELIQNRLAAGHSPLYFFYAKLFSSISPFSERALRVSSILCGALFIVFLCLSAVQMNLQRYLKAIWILAPVMPCWTDIAIQYRYYMPLMTMATTALWAGLAYLNSPSWTRGLLFFGLSLLAINIHHTAILFFLLLTGLILYHSHKESLTQSRFLNKLTLAMPVLGALAGYLPLLWLTHGHASALSRDHVKTNDAFKRVLETIFSDLHYWPRFFESNDSQYIYLAAVLVAAALAVALYLTRKQELKLAGRFILFIVAPYLILIGLYHELPGQRMEMKTRYILLLGIPLFYALAITSQEMLNWAAHSKTILKRGTGAIYFSVLGVFLTAQLFSVAHYRGDGHQQAVDWVCANANGQSPVFCAWGRSTILAINQQKPETITHAVFFRSKEGKAYALDEFRKKLVSTGASAGFVINYYAYREPAFQLVDVLKKEGVILEERRWLLSRRTSLGVFVTSPEKLAWLRNLKPPIFHAVERNT